MDKEANKDQVNKWPAANTGNASNPSPGDGSTEQDASHQYLDPKAEKYLREVSSIEDVPDAADQQEMDDTIRETNQENNA